MEEDNHHLHQPRSPPPLLRPVPNRPGFTLKTPSISPNPTPAQQLTPPAQTASFLDPLEPQEESHISHSRSVTNLTSSTLFGIYAPENLTSESATPWGDGTQTPAVYRPEGAESVLGSPRGFPNGYEIEERLRSHKARQTLREDDIRREKKKSKDAELRRTGGGEILRQGVLFGVGLAYGALVARLRDESRSSTSAEASGKGGGLDIATAMYLSFWGAAGIAMGNLLPWIDAHKGLSLSKSSSSPSPSLHTVEWSDVVRSIGAFIGIAFAIVRSSPLPLSFPFHSPPTHIHIPRNPPPITNISEQRKLPWETTLQLSLTLALTNPFLWYLLDRTTAGLLLSTSIGLFGTALLLAVNPDWIPAPTSLQLVRGWDASAFNGSSLPAGLFDAPGGMGEGGDWVGVATWICSVIFCSCVCFGSVGRVLVSRGSGR